MANPIATWLQNLLQPIIKQAAAINALPQTPLIADLQNVINGVQTAITAITPANIANAVTNEIKQILGPLLTPKGRR